MTGGDSLPIDTPSHWQQSLLDARAATPPVVDAIDVEFAPRPQYRNPLAVIAARCAICKCPSSEYRVQGANAIYGVCRNHIAALVYGQAPSPAMLSRYWDCLSLELRNRIHVCRQRRDALSADEHVLELEAIAAEVMETVQHARKFERQTRPCKSDAPPVEFSVSLFRRRPTLSEYDNQRFGAPHDRYYFGIYSGKYS